MLDPIAAFSLHVGCRFSLVVALNITGAAHYVVLPANSSLPTVVDSQALTTQSAATLFSGYTVAASGDMSIGSAFTNYSQAVLVRGTICCLLTLTFAGLSLSTILLILECVFQDALFWVCDWMHILPSLTLICLDSSMSLMCTVNKPG